MPDLNEEIKQATAKPDPNEQAQIAKLFELKGAIYNPWRLNYILRTLAQCYNFKELRQWEGIDETLLRAMDVPGLSIDRVNRGLDTIDGIRSNTGSKPKVVKRELGDERLATMLDRTREYFYYRSSQEEVEDSAFNNLKDVGLGITKCGYDPTIGEGEIWFEDVNVEDVWFRWGKKKDGTDCPWIIQREMMEWEEAILINPEKAPLIKGLKTMLQSEWDKIKDKNVQGQAAAVDYQNRVLATQGSYAYPDQVEIHEFWIRKVVPYKKIATAVTTEVPHPEIPGATVPVTIPQVSEQAIDYQPKENEQHIGTYVKVIYQQFVTCGPENNAILLKQGEDTEHPYIFMCSEKKKSGAPRGYIEIVMPHQQRINLAWAQVTAFYNRAIKAPLITSGTPYHADDVVQSSKLGAVLHLPAGTQVHSINTVPAINLPAVEEMNSAKADMDFAAAATEGVMRGVAEPGASGIKMSLQQNAAITPLNRWMKGLQSYQIALAKKVVRLIIRYVSPQRIARIIGEQEFNQLAIGPVDPMTGQPTQPPLTLPLNLDMENYDVEIEDQAKSDFQKQQTFNGVMALSGTGVPFTDDFKIKSAPIADVDAALDSNQKARTDIIMQLKMQVMQLTDALGQALKQNPAKPAKPNNQATNAQRGKNQPQAGPQSLLGGMGPGSPVAMGTQ